MLHVLFLDLKQDVWTSFSSKLSLSATFALIHAFVPYKSGNFHLYKYQEASIDSSTYSCLLELPASYTIVQEKPSLGASTSAVVDWPIAEAINTYICIQFRESSLITLMVPKQLLIVKSKTVMLDYTLWKLSIGFGERLEMVLCL